MLDFGPMTKRLILLASLGFGACGAEFMLGAITVTPEAWDKEGNFQKLDRYAREARAKGARVIVAPEGFLEGYVGNDKRTPDLEREKYFAVAEAVDGPLMGRVRGLAKELGVHLMVGFAERRGKEVFNSAVMFGPGGERVIHYSKTHTLADEPFNTKGVALPVVDTPMGKVGTLICFDRQMPETARVLAMRGAKIILVPAWGSYGEMNEMMMRVRAYENNVWLAFVHPKRSMLINPKGKIVAESVGETDQVVVGKVVIDEKAGPGLLEYRRPELYGELVSEPRR